MTMKFLIYSFIIIGGMISCVYSNNIDNPDNVHRELKRLGERIANRALVYEDPSEVSVYYDTENDCKIKKMLPRPWILPGQSLRLPFVGNPCRCENLQCGCCAGIKIEQLGFDREMCANITYSPEMFAIILDVFLNQNNIYHNVYSAQNPPPFCIPIVLGGVPTGVDVCVKLFDIHTIGTNIHVCVDFETRILSAPILVLHFECIRLGTDGVSLVKPDGGSEVGGSNPADNTRLINTIIKNNLRVTTSNYEDNKINP